MAMIILGSKLGSMALAYACGFGMFLLTMVLGLTPGNIPINVVLIIVSIIGAIGILELSGGLAYLVKLAEKLLRRHSKYINIVAPLVNFFMALLTGTGHTAYSTIPVIIQVAKDQNIKPVYPLSVAVVASQLAVIASPISAATIAMLGLLQPYNITIVQLMAILIPAVFFGCIILGIFASIFSKKINEDVIAIQEDFCDVNINNNSNLSNKGGKLQTEPHCEPTNKGATSVALFLVGIAIIMMYSIFPQLKPIYNDSKVMDTPLLIVIVMFSISLLMVLISKVKITDISSQTTFKAGMVAVICVIGVAWLGDTLILNYKKELLNLASDTLHSYKWLFFAVMFVISAILYSQSATILAIMPIGFALDLPLQILIPAIVCSSALFILPTYPTLIAAIEMDDTKSTKFGKYIFDHSLIYAGIFGIVICTAIAYLLTLFVI